MGWKHLACRLVCNYRNHSMKVSEAQLVKIGNSRGLRLPAEVIQRHQLENGILVEEHENQIVLKGKGRATTLSWEETARQMAAEDEGWEAWDVTTEDGLESVPWETGGRDSSRTRKRSGKKKVGRDQTRARKR